MRTKDSERHAKLIVRRIEQLIEARTNQVGFERLCLAEEELTNALADAIDDAVRRAIEPG